jgi:hypothetical protein
VASLANAYLILDKKQRLQLEDEYGPFLFLPEFIKMENKIFKRIFLFLAYKGFGFPLRLRWKWGQFRKRISVFYKGFATKKEGHK